MVSAFDDGIAELRRWAWPADEYVVFGSGPLHVHGIREASDVDVVVTQARWDRLVEAGHQPVDHRPGVLHLQLGPVEVLSGWWAYVGEPDEIVATGVLLGGIPFAPLDLVLRWKRRCDRPKDVVDVVLLEAHLEQHR